MTFKRPVYLLRLRLSSQMSFRLNVWLLRLMLWNTSHIQLTASSFLCFIERFLVRNIPLLSCLVILIDYMHCTKCGVYKCDDPRNTCPSGPPCILFPHCVWATVVAWSVARGDRTIGCSRARSQRPIQWLQLGLRLQQVRKWNQY